MNVTDAFMITLLLAHYLNNTYAIYMTVAHEKSTTSITGHKALREALRNTQLYSSDLQGDADVRDYRQIPLEVDPPRHHLYRSALAPYFVKPTIETHIPEFRAHSQDLVSSYFAKESSDVITNLTLPLVMKNLGSIYNRPQDVTEWISWGADVWTAESNVRDGAVLHRYLDRIYREALESSTQDIWYHIARLEIENSQIDHTEFRGIAGVLLAGGRDTVVKLLTGILWHFAHHPADLEYLRSNPEVLPNAIQEFLRFLSPLPVMNRTTVPESSGGKISPENYVSMNFISGNFDESVFENPFTIDFNRARNPHLSFGFGPHTCLGNHVAEIEAKVFLEVLIESQLTWSIDKEETIYHEHPYSKVPEQFKSLELRF